MKPPRDRPWMSVNFATSWDGRIGTHRRAGVNFTSPADKRRLLEIRALADAVLVSARTAQADRMTMGLPDPALRAAREARGQAPYPLRVLLSNRGRIPANLPLFEKSTATIIIFATEAMPRRTQVSLATRAELKLHAAEQVNLPAMLRTLRHEYRVRRLHCEGGGEVFRALLAQDLVDEIYLTLNPRIFGGAKGPTLTGEPENYLPKSVQAELREMEVTESECFLRYTVSRPA